ncbi:hypothetical protein [Streptomyces tateyamensis]|uniref:hypothetical protein n=1 Tax=Streptomyces tateyamensis TaxID=565073 RepID=UPI0015E8B0FA|nr:hypothetical protein [Streptomyces tateyamensis]
MTEPNTPLDGELLVPPTPSARTVLFERLPAELGVGALIGVGCALLGLLLGAMWYWLAPEVPLVVHGQSVLYVDPEGEQRAGGDGTFVLLGLGFGLVTAAAAFFATRRRGGGIAVAVGLGAGAVLGSFIGMWLGQALGPTSDLVAAAKAAGDGHSFHEALELQAKGALFAWPICAMVVLLALTAAFGKREEDPPPYWAGPQWGAGTTPLDDPHAPPTGPADAPSAPVDAPPEPPAVGGPADAPSAPADLGGDGTRQAQ